MSVMEKWRNRTPPKTRATLVRIVTVSKSGVACRCSVTYRLRRNFSGSEIPKEFSFETLLIPFGQFKMFLSPGKDAKREPLSAVRLLRTRIARDGVATALRDNKNHTEYTHFRGTLLFTNHVAKPL